MGVLGPVKMENVDYGKTKIKFLEKRSVSAPYPANIKMEDIDYGKTKIKFLKKRSVKPVLGPIKMENPKSNSWKKEVLVHLSLPTSKWKMSTMEKPKSNTYKKKETPKPIVKLILGFNELYLI